MAAALGRPDGDGVLRRADGRVRRGQGGARRTLPRPSRRDDPSGDGHRDVGRVDRSRRREREDRDPSRAFDVRSHAVHSQRRDADPGMASHVQGGQDRRGARVFADFRPRPDARVWILADRVGPLRSAHRETPLRADSRRRHPWRPARRRCRVRDRSRARRPRDVAGSCGAEPGVRNRRPASCAIRICGSCA